MQSPAAPAPAAAPDAPEPATTRAPTRRPVLLLLGLVSALAALAFPFAPVRQPDVTYHWSADQGAAALPLMPYQPLHLQVAASCDALRGAAGPALSTVPPHPDPQAEPLYGLVLTETAGGVSVQSAGVDLGTVALPPGPCTVTLTSDLSATTVSVDGAVRLRRAGDVRPDVAGVFSPARAGITLSLVTDTRFQTAITPLKAALGTVAVLALLAALAVLSRADAAVGRRVRLLPRGRPRTVDLVVTALLALWWLVGAPTVDDGYISGIVRGRGENGLIGNVYRWLNAPEAPFSWFYDVYYAWSHVSVATMWMRLLPTLLGLLCWALVRLLLPRLGRAGRRRSAVWVAALAFATWWVPLDLGLRPEPWVAVGLIAVVLAVERALATRRVLPLAVGLLLAGVTTALTPGGLIAFAPFLAAAVPLLRLLRARRDLHVAPLVAVLVAAPASALLLMAYSQSLAGMLESARVRTLISGGGDAWAGEYERYAELLSPTDFQGSIGRRAAVLVTLLAAAAVLATLARRRAARAGVASGPAFRLVVGLLLGVALLTFTPTKLTQHFGAFTGTGSAVLVVGAAVAARAALRHRPRAFVAALGGVTVIGALVLAGRNIWPFVGDWFTPPFSTISPRFLGHSVATELLGVGLLTVALLLGRSAWRRTAGAPPAAVPRWLPGPVPIMALLLVAVLALQVGGLARVAVEHRGSYTLASDAVATLRGDPCGLQRDLSVETDPAAGVLPSSGSTAGEQPVDIGGSELPGLAVSGREHTGWASLDPQQRSGALPVVVTTVGTLRPGDRLALEFAGPGGASLGSSAITTAATEPRDVRVLAPAGAVQVRLDVDAGTGGTGRPALVTLPRVPRLTPMEQLLPRGTRAVLDWPVAFAFPCLEPAALPLGTATVPQWRVAPPATDPSAKITYSPGFGGPFAAPRLLITEKRMPTYLTGDPTRDAVQLFRWTPVQPMRTLTPVVTGQTVTGWTRDGHARVPGLDPVG